jgi:3-deoxy-D-arabino-heptulosonate 7-phosphate (DAHP) synthase class II
MRSGAEIRRPSGWLREFACARRRCGEAIDRFDAFERAARRVEEALAFVDLETGQIRTAEKMQREIELAADEMLALDYENSRKVGRGRDPEKGEAALSLTRGDHA